MEEVLFFVGEAICFIWGGKCGEVEKDKEVFGELTIRDLACWTTLISGYVHQKLGEGMLSNICGRDSNDKSQKS